MPKLYRVLTRLFLLLTLLTDRLTVTYYATIPLGLRTIVPKGGIEDGETSGLAAVRESYEEGASSGLDRTDHVKA